MINTAILQLIIYHIFNVNVTPIPPADENFMITESGDRMITENGDYMITETA